MSGFGIIMLIFATCVLLVGIYMYTGHKLEIMTIRAAFRHLNKSEWKNLGKWTIITSIFIYVIALIGILLHL